MAERSEKNQEQAIAHYQASLRVYTEQDFPAHWARSQHNLGSLYSERLQGHNKENGEQAIAYFLAALRVYTRHVFPEQHRLTALSLAACAVRLRQWELAHTAAVYAREAEEDLLALAPGVMEMDTILRPGNDGIFYDAFALTRLGRYAEATEAVERGRARSLAAARLLQAADPQRIRDPQRREAYETHRTALRQAQAAVQQIATSRLPTSEEWLARTTALHEARTAFDATVAAICAAGDPADFLYDNFSSETLLHILAEKPAGHALIYLLPTPLGGIALGVFRGNPAVDATAHFASIDLLDLTVEAVHRCALRMAHDDISRPLGGYALAQGNRGLEIMKQSWDGNSFADSAACLHTFCQREQLTSTLDAAAQEIGKWPGLLDALKTPWQHLSKKQEWILHNRFNYSFLRTELQQNLICLAEIALRPLAAWLQEKNVLSITLIPCGLLAAFPLLAAPLEIIQGQSVTLADRYTASIAPSARALQQRTQSHQQRHGVAALGNPYPTSSSRPLPWGEAEALTLAELGGAPERASIQYDADRAHLLDMLQAAKVVDVSCHGIAEDEYLRSRLILANGENLTLADALDETITDMHGLRLLILSACQTAIPGFFGALDEVRSLTTGMLQAGARAVLASLWSVGDKATYLLMVRFAQEWFPYMETEPPAKALARAQCWLRTVTNCELQKWEAIPPLSKIAPELADLTNGNAKERESLVRWHNLHHRVQDAEELVQEQAEERNPDARPYADPFYWAGFQLYGW